jgi:hypothetical protein
VWFRGAIGFGTDSHFWVDDATGQVELISDSRLLNAPICKLYEPAARYRRKALRSLHYDCERLTLEVQGEGFAFARVVFRNPIGFRVLDEGDLCEFWNTYSEPNGWLYEVERGGWMELERNRLDFLTPQIREGMREFLVVDDKCVSILALHPPKLIDLGSAP